VFNFFRKSSSVRDVAPQEAKQLIDAGALVVDVREDFEWAHGHLPGSRHLPAGRLAAELDSLPRDRELILICASGSRSSHLCAALERHGFANLYNLSGGIYAWMRSGLPVVR